MAFKLKCNYLFFQKICEIAGVEMKQVLEAKNKVMAKKEKVPKEKVSIFFSIDFLLLCNNIYQVTFSFNNFLTPFLVLFSALCFHYYCVFPSSLCVSIHCVFPTGFLSLFLSHTLSLSFSPLLRISGHFRPCF